MGWGGGTIWGAESRKGASWDDGEEHSRVFLIGLQTHKTSEYPDLLKVYERVSTRINAYYRIAAPIHDLF